VASRSETLPYRLRESFLSSGEIAFYRVLQDMVRERFVICPKVALTDILAVARPNENVHFYNKIFRKNVDFLLLGRQNLKPVMGIRLVRPGGKDDIRESDKFLQDAFTTAGLPLVCVPVSESYDVAELLPLFRLALVKVKEEGAAIEENPADYSPLCPKCGITMVLRIHRTGSKAGTQYYGCMNYPECTETVSVK